MSDKNSIEIDKLLLTANYYLDIMPVKNNNIQRAEGILSAIHFWTRDFYWPDNLQQKYIDLRIRCDKLMENSRT